MLKSNETAQILDICYDTLRDWEVSGKLVPLKTKGGHRRYQYEQLVPFIDESKHKFISKVKEKYGDRLDCSKVKYIDCHTEVILLCPVHGEFLVKPKYFLTRGFACKKCESDVLTEKLENKYLGLVFGNRKVMGFQEMRPLKIDPSRPCGRLWKAECLNCESVVVEAIDVIKKLGVCKVCKNRPKGETGLLFHFNHYKKSARDRKLSFELTQEQFRSITSQSCHYCGADPTPTRGVVLEWSQYLCNGIDRKDNTIGYVKENCLPCCTTCNSAKMDKTYSEFIDYLDKLVIYRSNQ